MLLIAIHAIGLGALLIGAIAIFRTYCEGFGCIGIGIMWFAWAGVYAAWLIYGGIAHARLKEKPAQRQLAGRLIAGQVAVGVALLAYWALKNFR